MNECTMLGKKLHYRQMQGLLWGISLMERIRAQLSIIWEQYGSGNVFTREQR